MPRPRHLRRVTVLCAATALLLVAVVLSLAVGNPLVIPVQSALPVTDRL